MPDVEQRLELYRHLLGKLTGETPPDSDGSTAAPESVDEVLSVEALGGMLPAADEAFDAAGSGSDAPDDGTAAPTFDAAADDPVERKLQILKAMLDQLHS